MPRLRYCSLLIRVMHVVLITVFIGFDCLTGIPSHLLRSTRLKKTPPSPEVLLSKYHISISNFPVNPARMTIWNRNRGLLILKGEQVPTTRLNPCDPCSYQSRIVQFPY